jgi:serine/threonine-protein kinase
MDRTHLEPGSPVPRPPSDPLHEPRSVGDYRILRRLGEGGMGSVYLGYHEGQDHQVAIKILPDQLAGNQAYVERFYREARSGALLNHPNIVRGLTVGQDQATNRHYIVLEYIDGPNALALLEQVGRLSVADTVHIGLDVARALEHAHSRNIVHRDIKPDNILITRSGVAKLSDLGLAKRTDETSHLTATRQGFGTPYYMPYEQAINAKHADARSDIYALGATLYHLVAGAVPFPGDNHLEVMEKKEGGQFPLASSHNPEVPPVLDQILTRMLARNPRDRYQTASELIVDLERSRLAAPMLSFADPDLAMKDPWVQACLSSAAQPTMPDLEGAAGHKAAGNGQAATPDGPDEIWYLRRRGRDGSWRQVRATRQQILRQLRAGHLPGRVEASREADGDYRSLTAYPEFASVRPVRKKGKEPTPKSADKQEPLAASDVRTPRRGRWLLLAVGLGAAGLLVLAVVLYWVFVQWAK